MHLVVHHFTVGPEQMKFSRILVLILFASWGSAKADIITFDGNSAPGTSTELPGTPNIEGDWTYQETFGNTFWVDAGFQAGHGLTDDALLLNSPLLGASVTITRTDLGAFDFTSLRLGNFHASSAGDIRLIGNLVGGGMISAISPFVGNPTVLTWSPTGFNNLSSLVLQANSATTGASTVVIDDIVVSAATGAAVPEPSSFAFLGLGALGIGLVRRRSKRQQASLLG